jgi:short-subunit dehydrogenase
MVQNMPNALVTGASSGIGRALAVRLLDKGYTVLGIGRNEEQLKELASKYTGFTYMVADLSNPENIEKIKNKVASSFSPLDLLVNNAGYGQKKKITEMAQQEITSMVNVNFVAPLLLINSLLPYMPQGSTVVNVVTAGIFVLMRQLPLYGATKIALHYASKALRNELRQKGINLVQVYPGLINTNFHPRAGLPEATRGEPPEKVADAIIKAIEKKKKEVFVPGYLAILKILGPQLPEVF